MCFKQRLGLHSDGASKGSAPLATKGMTNADHQLALAPPMTKEVCLESPLGYDEAKAQPSVADDHWRTSAFLGLHSDGASKGLAPPLTKDFVQTVHSDMMRQRRSRPRQVSIEDHQLEKKHRRKTMPVPDRASHKSVATLAITRTRRRRRW